MGNRMISERLAALRKLLTIKPALNDRALRAQLLCMERQGVSQSLLVKNPELTHRLNGPFGAAMNKLIQIGIATVVQVIDWPRPLDHPVMQHRHLVGNGAH